MAVRARVSQHTVSRRIQHGAFTQLGFHGLKVDAKIVQQAPGYFAPGIGAIHIDRATDTQQRVSIMVKLVAFGMSAKVVMIVQHQNRRIGSHPLLIESCSRKTTHARTHDYHIVVFIELLIVGGLLPIPCEGVRYLERARVITAHPGQERWVVIGRCGLREQHLRCQQGGAGTDGHTVHKISSCNFVCHRIKTPLPEWRRSRSQLFRDTGPAYPMLTVVRNNAISKDGLRI